MRDFTVKLTNKALEVHEYCVTATTDAEAENKCRRMYKFSGNISDIIDVEIR